MKETIFIDLTKMTILEIGAGVGFNLPYYKEAKKVYLLEPNQQAHQYIRVRSKKLGLKVSILAGYAESMPFADQKMDVIVCLFTLCSVADIDKALKEISRVLKPSGRLILLEHVAVEKGIQKLLQKTLRPFWRRIANGCDCHRDIPRLISSSGLFKLIVANIVKNGPSLFLGPWYLGVWQKN
ncbi:MAG: class I SAM-dependent methyltransferase [bacterium]